MHNVGTVPLKGMWQGVYIEVNVMITQVTKECLFVWDGTSTVGACTLPEDRTTEGAEQMLEETGSLGTMVKC